MRLYSYVPWLEEIECNINKLCSIIVAFLDTNHMQRVLYQILIEQTKSILPNNIKF